MKKCQFRYNSAESHGRVFECACLRFSTHRLQRLEAAVEEEVPDDFAVLKGRDVPYEEICQNSQRGGEDDPAEEQRKRHTSDISAWKCYIFFTRYKVLSPSVTLSPVSQTRPYWRYLDVNNTMHSMLNVYFWEK